MQVGQVRLEARREVHQLAARFQQSLPQKHLHELNRDIKQRHLGLIRQHLRDLAGLSRFGDVQID